MAGRLRTVLADPGSVPGSAMDPPTPATDQMSPGVWRVFAGPPPAPPVPSALTELAEVGEPLDWSDIIPAWPEDVDLDKDTLPPPPKGFPPGSPWATPPADRGEAVPSHLGDLMDETRQPLPPPAWVVLDQQEDEVPPVLSTAGAFGGPADDGRRLGLRAFDPGRRGVRALAAVAVVVVLLAALLAWRSRPRVDSVTPPTFEVTRSAGAVAPAAARSPAGPAEVVVAVGGKVRRPGMVRLPSGARVADALRAAGGPQPGVDVALLNLARKVVDGELIVVGVTPPPGVATGPAAPGPAGGAPAGGPVNLNTATLAELDGLPGVGPVLAQRILDARDAQGGFTAVTDLRKVDGIGDARYEQLKDLVTV